MKKIILLTILLCTSCGILRQKYATQIQHDTTTIYQNNTTYLHDSIYVWRDRIIYERGDTIHDKTVEYRDRYRIKEVHDTLYKDRIKYEYKEIPIEVEKELTRSQRLMLNLGKVFSLLLVVALGYGAIKLYKKFRI